MSGSPVTSVLVLGLSTVLEDTIMSRCQVNTSERGGTSILICREVTGISLDDCRETVCWCETEDESDTDGLSTRVDGPFGDPDWYRSRNT